MHFHYFKSSCALKISSPAPYLPCSPDKNREFSEFNLKVSVLENYQDQGQVFHPLYLPPGVPLVHRKKLLMYEIPKKF